MYNIYILTNTSEGLNIGDKNQALAIQRELIKNFGDRVINSEEVNIDDKSLLKVKNKIKESEKNIIIGIGAHGITALKKLTGNKNVITVWAGHQKFDNLDDIINKVDIISLPKYVKVNKKDFTTTKLVETVKVAHNVTNEELNNIEWDKEIPESKKYISVFLGGDAHDINGNLSLFTEKEARYLAKEIADEAKKQNALVLITNSPRTGKYDSKTKEIISENHKDSQLDAVTAVFLKVLDRNKVKYCFENFIFGQPSAYKIFLKKAKETSGDVYVTGDSISMISEISDHIPSQNLYVVKVGSMSDAHLDNLEFCYKANICKKMEVNRRETFIYEYFDDDANYSKSAAKEIADKVVEIASPPMLFSYKTNVERTSILNEKTKSLKV